MTRPDQAYHRVRPTTRCDRPKVFGIGLSRTGGTSLSHALARLGLKTVHFPATLTPAARSSRISMKELRPAPADDPSRSRQRLRYAGLLRLRGPRRGLLRRQVHPHRPRRGGVASLMRSVLDRLRKAPSPPGRASRAGELGARRPDALRSGGARARREPAQPSTRPPDRPFGLHVRCRGPPLRRQLVDAARFAERRRSYELGVQRHFAARPEKLLVLDVCNGEGWEKLCAFLGLEGARASVDESNLALRHE